MVTVAVADGAFEPREVTVGVVVVDSARSRDCVRLHPAVLEAKDATAVSSGNANLARRMVVESERMGAGRCEGERVLNVGAVTRMALITRGYCDCSAGSGEDATGSSATSTGMGKTSAICASKIWELLGMSCGESSSAFFLPKMMSQNLNVCAMM